MVRQMRAHTKSPARLLCPSIRSAYLAAWSSAMLAEFVHHLVCGAQDFEIGQHNFLPSSLDRLAGVRDGAVGSAFQPE
jgi:hypothetical protein